MNHDRVVDPADDPSICEQFDQQWPTYHAGRVSDVVAERLESHAASCARCEALLEAASRVPIDAFAPPLPPSLRASTMTAIAASTASSGAAPVGARSARRWTIGAAALLAAAAAYLFVRTPQQTIDAPPVYATSATAAPEPFPDNAAIASAARLAAERARAEFESLDAAARELEGALASTPDDAELRAYLAAVRARRSELLQRVKEAAS